ncbi:hypothetical protein [Periweissella fabalis]|uniref:Uncharacterized protein n=1 Tax=Periweissella fabalis TaxID=1070421 RepID=A0A7X6S491_9LACO|nr:hypothetical protein [Periweissella fabalis]MCM0598462.1 hypothetical protein [Periweissella fabalis]NKZ25011.1 hypothetical protein [Periweissella fabalis]
MHFNKEFFNAEILVWENSLREKLPISENTIKGNYKDLLHLIKIIIFSFNK